MKTQAIDTARAEAFADSMVDTLNRSMLALMISIGHRTGLFDAMSDLPPGSAAAIAKSAGLQERYVREWLACLVAGGIVDYVAEAGTYALPAEHAAFLTRAAAPNNLAVYAQYVPLLGSIEERIIECFREGGGVPYEAYGRFHEVMAEDSGQTVLPALLESILPLAPGLVERLQEGIDVLDVGCGMGRALTLMAETFPNSRFVGYDLATDAVARAQDAADERRLRNLRFEARDLTDFDRTAAAQFDLVTAFDAIHDQARPDRVLAGIYRTLRPNGIFLMQDIAASSHVHKNIDHPLGPMLYAVSCLHCMTVSLAQNGKGLGAMWGEELAIEMLGEAGFEGITTHRLPHDIQNTYFVVTREPVQQRAEVAA